MSSTQTGFLDSLVSAARENPLATALIGGGAFWLLAGNDRLKNAVDSTMAAASPLVDIGARNLRAASSVLQSAQAPPTAPEMDHGGAFNAARDAASAASDATSGAISGAADKIKHRFDAGLAYAADGVRQLAEPLPGKEDVKRAQSRLVELLEQQPLVIGALGLAIGATVASAFRTSELEHEWVGDISNDVKADLTARSAAVSQGLREASDTLRAELGETGAEGIDRLKQAGINAADAARETMRRNSAPD